MTKIHCNHCNEVLSQQWEFIFIDSGVFQFKVSISWCSFIQFSLQVLLKTCRTVSPGCYKSQNVGWLQACKPWSKLNCTIKMFCFCSMNLLNKHCPWISTAPETQKIKLFKEIWYSNACAQLPNLQKSTMFPCVHLCSVSTAGFPETSFKENLQDSFFLQILVCWQCNN